MHPLGAGRSPTDELGKKRRMTQFILRPRALELTNPEGVPAPFSTKASSEKQHEAYGKDFFVEMTKYNPHFPYSASKASSDHFVRAFHDTYGMPTIVTNCSNN